MRSFDDGTSLFWFIRFNKLPKEIRDECRQDPTVSRNVLVEIVRKKQERSMLTEFKKYRDQQQKAAAKETADAIAPAARKRTKAEVKREVTAAVSAAHTSSAATDS